MTAPKELDGRVAIVTALPAASASKQRAPWRRGAPSHFALCSFPFKTNSNGATLPVAVDRKFTA